MNEFIFKHLQANDYLSVDFIERNKDRFDMIHSSINNDEVGAYQVSSINNNTGRISVQPIPTQEEMQTIDQFIYNLRQEMNSNIRNEGNRPLADYHDEQRKKEIKRIVGENTVLSNKLPDDQKITTSKIELNKGEVKFKPVIDEISSSYVDPDTRFHETTEVVQHYLDRNREYKTNIHLHEAEMRFIDRITPEGMKSVNTYDAYIDDVIRILSNDTVTRSSLTSSISSPEDIVSRRDSIITMIENAKGFRQEITSDRRLLNESLNMISTVLKGEETFQSYIQNDNFKDLELIKLINNRINNDLSEDRIRYTLSQVLSDRQFMNVSVPFGSSDYKETWRMQNTIKTSLQDSYNLNSHQYALYHQVDAFNRELKDLVSIMFDDHRDASQDFREYLDNAIDKQDIINRAQSAGLLDSSLSDEEKRGIIIEGSDRFVDITASNENQYREGVVVRNMLEEMDQRKEAFLRSVDIDDKGTFPRQPSLLIGNAVDLSMMKDPNSPEMKQKGEERLRNYKDILRKIDDNKTRIEDDYWSLKADHHNASDEFMHLVRQHNAGSSELSEIEYQEKYNELQRRVRDREEQVRNAERILNQGGYDPLMKVTVDGNETRLGQAMSHGEVETFRQLFSNREKAIAEGLEFDPSVKVYEEKRPSLDTKQSWLSLAENNERVRLQGSQVGYEITSIQDDHVFLKKEHIPLKNVSINLDFDPEEIRPLIQKIDEKSIIGKEVAKEIAEEVVQSGRTNQPFINVRFDQNPIHQSMQSELGDFIFGKMRQADLVLQQQTPSAFGTKNIFVSPDNLHEQLSKVYISLYDESNGIGSRPRMPAYVMDVLQSHAGFILSDSARAVGTAYEATDIALQRIAREQGTIDITDEGMIQQWKNSVLFGRSDLSEQEVIQQTEKLMDNLNKLGPEDRLRNYLFMDIVREAHNVHFSEITKESDGLSTGTRLHMQAIEESSMRLSPEAMYDLAHSKEMRDAYSQAPHYSHLARTSIGEFRDAMLSNPQLEENVTIFADDVIEPGHKLQIDSLDDQLADEYRQREDLTEEQRRWLASYDEQQMHASSVDRINLMQEEGGSTYRIDDQLEVYASDEELAKQMKTINYSESKQRYYGMSSLETFLDFAEESGRPHIKGTAQVDIDGEVRTFDALYYRGQDNEILAHVPSLNKRFAVSEHGMMLDTVMNMNTTEPERMYGGSTITRDIGYGGSPKRDSWGGSFATMQRSGAYTIPSNPSVTLDEMLRFFRGSTQMTYMDIEFTGLKDSTIDNKYLQPIEVYAEKIQWGDNGFLIDDEGEYVVRNRKGEEIRRTKHFLVSLDDNTRSFMQDIVDNEDFTFRVGDQTFSAIEYAEQLRRSQENPNARSQIHEAILSHSNSSAIHQEAREKLDRLWFLRNIAKYAWTEDEINTSGTQAQSFYNIHAGNTGISIEDGGADRYLSNLRSHAQQAADNLSRVGVKDGFVFAEGQVGGTINDMVRSINAFVGNSPVLGQNVAQADWQVMMDSVSKAIMNTEEMIQGIQASSEDIINRRTSSFLDEINTLRNELFTNVRDTFSHTGHFDHPEASYLFDEQTHLGPYQGENNAYRYNSISEWMKSVNQLQDTSSPSPDGRGTFSIRDLVDPERLRFATVDVEEITDLENLYRAIRDQGIEGVTPDLMEIVERDHRLENAFNALQTSSNYADRRMAKAEREMNQLERIGGRFANQPLVEQMYLSQIINPGLDSHSAEAQMEKWGITPDAMHLAKDDVRNNLKLTEKYANELIHNLDFLSTYNNTPFKVGDVVEMYKQLGQDGALGVYQIRNIDLENNFIDIDQVEGDGRSIRVEGASGADLSRRFETHFSFIGTPSKTADIRNVLDEHHYDQSRRAILRSMDGAFQFEQMMIEADEINRFGQLQHESVQNMHQLYRELRRIEDPDVMYTHDRSALQSASLFETGDIYRILDKQVTPQQAAALQEGLKFSQSEFGQQQLKFLSDVRDLEQVHAITNNQAKTMISEWNEAIKEEGKRRGAKHSVMNRHNLGTMELRPSSSAQSGVRFENRLLDLSDSRRIESSLWRWTNDIMNVPFLTSGNAKDQRQQVLKDYVAPFLAERGLINDMSIINEGQAVSMGHLVSEIEKNKGNVQFPLHEQFNPLAYDLLSEDQEMLNFMEQRHHEILSGTKSQLSVTQEALIENLNERRGYLRDIGYYHPVFNMAPDATEHLDVVMDTMQFNKYGGIGNFTSRELAERASLLEGSIDQAAVFDARNTIFSELYFRGTGGRNISGQLDDIIQMGEYRDQFQALRALNWVVENPDFNPELPENYSRTVPNPVYQDHAESIRGMMEQHQAREIAAGYSLPHPELPDSVPSEISNPDYNPRYIENMDIGSRYLGVAGDYSGSRMADVPSELLNRIASEEFGKYTRDNQYAYTQSVIQNWYNNDLVGHSGTDQIPWRVYTDENGDPVVRQNLAQAIEDTKARGRSSTRSSEIINPADNIYQNFVPRETNLTDPTPPRPEGAIERGVSRMRNWATEVVDSARSMGSAGRWIAGIGVAAFALNAFRNANTPIQLETRPDGHGAPNINGKTHDDIQYGDKGVSPSVPDPSTEKSAYMTAGDGYTIRAKGKASNDLNYNQMRNQLQEQIGDVNINMRDDRETFNREWLQQSFNSYIDRGYVE